MFYFLLNFSGRTVVGGPLKTCEKLQSRPPVSSNPVPCLVKIAEAARKSFHPISPPGPFHNPPEVSREMVGAATLPRTVSVASAPSSVVKKSANNAPGNRDTA
ncbi:hypothetical protein MTP99_002394 [Tenebrio molitor]|nr:hypothetical protein MTP99_002394 [Tenebrio molitor]